MTRAHLKRYCEYGHQLGRGVKPEDCVTCLMRDRDEAKRTRERAEIEKIRARPAPLTMIVRRGDGGPPQIFTCTPRTHGRRR